METTGGINKSKTGISLLILTLTILMLSLSQCSKQPESASITLAPLPYAEDALEPHISANTIRYHYGKHHAAYVSKTNQLLKHTLFKNETIEEIIIETAGDDLNVKLFNNAAQAFNHAFFWKCLSPEGGGLPGDTITSLLNESFGSYYSFRESILKAAKKQFGSGWVWLVHDGNRLKIITTENADTPIAHGLTPLFTIDVWEHSYYLDYQNERGDYIVTIMDHLINWEFVESNLP